MATISLSKNDKNLIKFAEKEIKEWRKFIVLIKKHKVKNK
jgi:hypothetical protein